MVLEEDPIHVKSSRNSKHNGAVMNVWLQLRASHKRFHNWQLIVPPVFSLDVGVDFQ